MTGCTKCSVSETSDCHSKWKRKSLTEHVRQHAVYPKPDVSQSKLRMRRERLQVEREGEREKLPDK